MSLNHLRKNTSIMVSNFQNKLEFKKCSEKCIPTCIRYGISCYAGRNRLKHAYLLLRLRTIPVFYQNHHSNEIPESCHTK